MNSQIPDSFYLIVGVMIFSNVGAVITILTFLFKAGKFVGETEAGIESARESAFLANSKIDKHVEVFHG